jgi:two-component system, NtrC family, response regulator AtoC
MAKGEQSLAARRVCIMGLTTAEAGVPEIVGTSAIIRKVISLIDKVASSDCCVLIEGESGTGKELLARRLCAKSPRKNKPFIPINCAGISETLFESQFFGHVRGAFTGAEQSMLGLVRTADSGTLFLDEVGEIPLNLQPKLLRVIQEQEVMPIGKPIPIKVDTRFIAGTNRNLRELVQHGKFRQDLYFRLNIVRVEVPPLRHRLEDLPLLLDHFANHYARHYKRKEICISSTIRKLLMSYPWPGNVREVAAWVERLYATGLEAEVLVEALLIESEEKQEKLPIDGLSLRQLERCAIEQAMDRTDFNQRKAARLLKVHRATLARKLKKHGLT